MSHLIRLIGNLDAPDFQGFVCSCYCQTQVHHKLLLFQLPRMVATATTYSLYNLIRGMDRSSEHLNIVNLTLINCIVSSNQPFLYLLSGSCPLVGSLCQFDSPVLLWTGCDNGTLPAICNPPFDSPLWIMYCTRNLTNLLGMPIYKNPE